MNIRKIISLFLQTIFISIIFIAIPIFLIFLNDYFNLPTYVNVYFKIIGAIFVITCFNAVIYSAILHIKTGRETPLPVIEQPKQFMIYGLYKYCRNPMYLSETFIFLGMFLLSGKVLLLLYSVVFFVIIHLFVIYAEEPELKRIFGEQYSQYLKGVPRWIPKM